MAKIPKDPKEVLPEIIEDYRALFGAEMKSIILYGSAAGEDYRPGLSDINLMVVVTEKGIESLDQTFKTVGKWLKRKVAIPLFLTPAYIESSTDVFPIEYLGFQRKHILVYGEDYLKNLVFKPQWIRLQCERDIKGKLLLLREAFVESAGRSRALREVVGPSIQAFLAVFEALLTLKEKDLPADKREILRATCEVFDLDAALFEKLLDIREKKSRPGDEEMKTLFKKYMKEIRKLAISIDAMGG
ncbi:MAG: hypothetical protein ABII06_13925 [Pseudomonadota bacterium]